MRVIVILVIAHILPRLIFRIYIYRVYIFFKHIVHYYFTMPHLIEIQWLLRFVFMLKSIQLYFNIIMIYWDVINCKETIHKIIT